MRSLNELLSDPKSILKGILKRTNYIWPDKTYIKLLYKFSMGSKLNLKNPKKFSEKIQWLKLYDRRPEYTHMVDKDSVKSYVSSKIGNDHIIPTIDTWDSVEDIEWEKLPEQFVLKTTHGGGSGGVLICENKKKLNKEEAQIKLKKAMKANIYMAYREWPYKNVQRKIIAEKFLIPEKGGELKDYKFFCFNGIPKFLKVDFGRFVEHHANYYDLKWNLLPYGETGLEPDPNHSEEMPENFERMVEISKLLSSGYPFVRVDLYNLNGKIYFGELTFYPASGFLPWTKDETDLEIGNFITLPIAELDDI